MTFLILFGLGVSPLPTETPQLFSTRIAYVLFAVVYAIGLATLLWPSTHAGRGDQCPAQPIVDQ